MRVSAAAAVLMLTLGTALAGPPPPPPPEFKPESPPEGAPPSKTMERATKLYDRKDYLSASIELYKVLQHETADDEGQVQRAQHFLAKTLFQLELYAPALARLQEIANAGPTHRWYAASIKWVVASAKMLPASSGVLAVIGQYPRDLLTPELTELLDGELRTAGALLDAGKVAEARAAFGKLAKTRDVAALVLGRMALRAGKYDDAVKAYALVPAGSQRIDEALFERSLAVALKAGVGKGLEELVPAGWGGEGPEVDVLPALASYDFCSAGAGDAFARFRAAHKKLAVELAGLAGQAPDDEADLLAHVKTAKLSPRTRALLRAVMASPRERGAVAFVDELERELKLFSSFDAAWRTTMVAAEALQEIMLQKALAQAFAGKLLRLRIGRLVTQLDEVAKRTAALQASAGDPTPAPGVKGAKPASFTFTLRREACGKR